MGKCRDNLSGKAVLLLTLCLGLRECLLVYLCLQTARPSVKWLFSQSVKMLLYTAATCVENVEMLKNLTAVKEMLCSEKLGKCQGITCQGKLFIAHFMFGVLSVFTRLSIGFVLLCCKNFPA